jgi:hypothetical protein
MCISCVSHLVTFSQPHSRTMALPTWLSVAFTIADFVVQRVDRVGPVSFEPPEKQPPEHAAAETVDAPEMGDTSVDEAPPAEVDTPQSFGFQAGGGGGPSPSGGNGGGGSGNGDNGDDSSARAGGGGQPSSGDEPTGGSDDDDDDGDSSAQLARAGGGNDPTPAPPPGGGGSGGDDDDDDNGEEQEHHDDRSVLCSFRSMRPSDTPTRYEVEQARDDAGEERPA